MRLSSALTCAPAASEGQSDEDYTNELPGNRVEYPRQQQADAEERAEHLQPVAQALRGGVAARVYGRKHGCRNRGIEDHHQDVHQRFLPAPMSKASCTTR